MFRLHGHFIPEDFLTEGLFGTEAFNIRNFWNWDFSAQEYFSTMDILEWELTIWHWDYSEIDVLIRGHFVTLHSNMAISNQGHVITVPNCSHSKISICQNIYEAKELMSKRSHDKMSAKMTLAEILDAQITLNPFYT